MRLDRFITLNIVQPWRRISSALFRRSAAQDSSVPVLMYHNIIDDPEPGIAPYYKVNTSPKVFAEHMQFLADQGYQTITISDLVKSLSAHRTTVSATHGLTDSPSPRTTVPTPKSDLRSSFSALDGSASSSDRTTVPQYHRTTGSPSFSDAKRVVITFDDGFSSVYTEAFPVLKKHGFTATVFLATAFIGDERREFKPAGSLRRSTSGPALSALDRTTVPPYHRTTALDDTVSPSGRSPEGRAASPRTPAQNPLSDPKVSALPGSDSPSDRTTVPQYPRTPALDDTLSPSDRPTVPPSGSDPNISAFSFQLSAFPLSRSCLTWAQIREMSDYGIEFGSHTVSHPKLVDLDWPEIIAELRNSKQSIEENLGKQVTSFCYPYAFPQQDKSFVLKLIGGLAEAGYSNCSTTQIGRVNTGSCGSWLRRLPANSSDDLDLLNAKLNGGYDWLAKPQFVIKSVKHSLRH